MKNKRILVCVAHPDDEVLGCGGAIAVHTRSGSEVHLLIMADGVTSRTYDPDNNMSREKEIRSNARAIAKRQKETAESARILGIKKEQIYHLGLADQRLDQYPFLDLVKRIERIQYAIKPHIVYTHFWNDLNLDHRLVSQAAMTAFRQKAGKKAVRLFQMEIPESTSLSIPDGGKAFVPNHFLDISSALDVKLQALDAYRSEQREYPDPRSRRAIQELARARGQKSRYRYAEAFVSHGQ